MVEYIKFTKLVWFGTYYTLLPIIVALNCFILHADEIFCNDSIYLLVYRQMLVLYHNIV